MFCCRQDISLRCVFRHAKWCLCQSNLKGCACSGGNDTPSWEYHLSPSFLGIVPTPIGSYYSGCFLIVCSHYVLIYCDHYHYLSTCDCCVLWSITHHYDSYAISYLCGPDDIRSGWCGSATTIDSKGHYEGSCWPHHYAAVTTSVPNASSGICQLCHGSSVCKFWAFSDSLCRELVSVIVFSFCFHVPMWLPCSPMEHSLWGLQHCNPWEVYVPPVDGL